jgi:hypothetical protein
MVKFWVAASLWIQQRIITATPEKPDRACRRRLEKDNLGNYILDSLD